MALTSVLKGQNFTKSSHTVNRFKGGAPGLVVEVGDSRDDHEFESHHRLIDLIEIGAKVGVLKNSINSNDASTYTS